MGAGSDARVSFATRLGELSLTSYAMTVSDGYQLIVDKCALLVAAWASLLEGAFMAAVDIMLLSVAGLVTACLLDRIG